MWLLEIEPGSYVTVLGALNHWAIFLVSITKSFTRFSFFNVSNLSCHIPYICNSNFVFRKVLLLLMWKTKLAYNFCHYSLSCLLFGLNNPCWQALNNISIWAVTRLRTLQALFIIFICHLLNMIWKNPCFAISTMTLELLLLGKSQGTQLKLNFR